jgi:hypothetical protein
MNKLLQTTALAAIIAMTGAAYADNHEVKTDQNAAQTMENSTEQSGDAMEQAAEKTGSTAESTTEDATGQQDDAMNAAGSDDSNMAAKESMEDMDESATKRDGVAIFVLYKDMQAEGAVRASDLIGMNVYAAQKDVDESSYYNEAARRDWNDIGEINDVIVGWNGEVKGVILGVGGFLGLGEKNVAVDMSSLRRVRESGDSNDWFLVVNSTRQALEDAPSYAPAS